MTPEEIAAKAEKDAAMLVVKNAAIKAAEDTFTAKSAEFIALELKSDASKALIKELAQSVMDSLEIKEADGKVTTLNTIIKEMQDQHDALSKKVKAEGAMKEQTETIIAQIKKQFFEKAAELSNVASKSSGSVRFEVKAASDPISVTSFGDRVIFGLREPGIDSAPLPQRFIFDIIQVMNGGVGSNPLSWVEQVAGAGAPAWTAESATKSAMNWTYVERKVTAEMIAVYTVITRQALLNWPILEQEIRGELSRKLYNKLDESVLNGDGTNNEILGINSYATAFDAGSLAGTIEDANATDVLRAAIGQVRKGGATASATLGGFSPTYCVISEDASTTMDLGKNVNGTYLLPPFISQDNTKIKGTPIITTNFIADDAFIVGDFSRYLFNIVDGLKIDIGYINEQFIHNQLTIRAELYGMGRVKNHEKPAFVKGTFTAAIDDLIATT